MCILQSCQEHFLKSKHNMYKLILISAYTKSIAFSSPTHSVHQLMKPLVKDFRLCIDSLNYSICRGVLWASLFYRLENFLSDGINHKNRRAGRPSPIWWVEFLRSQMRQFVKENGPKGNRSIMDQTNHSFVNDIIIE